MTPPHPSNPSASWAADPSVPTCPGCGLRAPDAGGLAPAEHRASPGCYALYGELIARDYADPEYYRRAHQVIVDAYAAQHAGGTSRRETQTVGLCLMTLCLFVEDGVPPADGPALHKRMVAHRPDFPWLQPPPTHGLMTVADVLRARTADEHAHLALQWGEQVWQAWKPHHATIRAWNSAALQQE